MDEPSKKSVVIEDEDAKEALDDELKLNWKNLMCVNKERWDTARDYPISETEWQHETSTIFYMGKSEINGEETYFRVSDDYIPLEEESPVFDDSFLNDMGYNIEKPLTSVEENLLREAVTNRPFYQVKWILPVIIDGKKWWKGKRRNGSHTDPQDDSWLKKSFLKTFPDYYAKLHDDVWIDQYVDLPMGYVMNSHKPKEDTTIIPLLLKTNIKIKFRFGSKAYCAFGNMANAMSLFNDELAANFFFINRHQSVENLMKSMPKLKFNARKNQFFYAMDICRNKFGYVVRSLGPNYSKPWEDRDTDRNIVKYVEMQAGNNWHEHAVCIYNDVVYDGSFKYGLKLSEATFRYICDDDHVHLRCYSIEQSKKTKRILDKRADSKNDNDTIKESGKKRSDTMTHSDQRKKKKKKTK